MSLWLCAGAQNPAGSASAATSETTETGACRASPQPPINSDPAARISPVLQPRLSHVGFAAASCFADMSEDWHNRACVSILHCPARNSNSGHREHRDSRAHREYCVRVVLLRQSSANLPFQVAWWSSLDPPMDPLAFDFQAFDGMVAPAQRDEVTAQLAQPFSVFRFPAGGVRFVKTHFQSPREEDDPSGTPDTPATSTYITIYAATSYIFVVACCRCSLCKSQWNSRARWDSYAPTGAVEISGRKK